MTMGIAANTLSDDELRHELLQLKTKQHEIAESGTTGQQANHRRRTAELEAEFLRRFGHSHPHPVTEPDTDADPQPGGAPGAGVGPSES